MTQKQYFLQAYDLNKECDFVDANFFTTPKLVKLIYSISLQKMEEDRLIVERRKTFVSNEVKIKRAKFNAQRLKTQPNGFILLNQKDCRSRKNNPYPRIPFSDRKHSKLAGQSQSGSGRKTCHNKMLMSMTDRENNVWEFKTSKKANMRDCKYLCQGYEFRERRLKQNDKGLSNFLKDSSKCYQDRETVRSSLEKVVGRIGRSLMQRVPNIRLRSQQEDQFLISSRKQFYFDFSDEGNKEKQNHVNSSYGDHQSWMVGEKQTQKKRLKKRIYGK